MCGCCSYEWDKGRPSLAATTRVMPLRIPLAWLSKEVLLFPNNPKGCLLLSSLVINPLHANCCGESRAALSTKGWRWGVHGAEWGSSFGGLKGDPSLWLKECRGDAGSEWIPPLRLENGNWGEPGRGLKAVGFCKTGEPVCDSWLSLDTMDFGESKWSRLAAVPRVGVFLSSV